MMWQGWRDDEASIPDKLSLPKDRQWIERLESILAVEKHSRLQYEADEKKYGVYMPYGMILPQEYNHIRWIEKLLTAYGMAGEIDKTTAPQIFETETLEQAYQTARKLESDLIPNYEWLIGKAPDDASRSVLGTILLQTRFHYVMFDHALRMGSHMGGGWMMNP